jgi:hypothetical protein
VGFSNVKAVGDAIDLGQQNTYSWRKSPAQSTTLGIWNDLSMAPGNPIPNYYASSPLVAATLNGAEGFFHGPDVETVVSTFTANAGTDVITYPWDIPDGTAVTVSSTGVLPSAISLSSSTDPLQAGLQAGTTYYLQRLSSTTGKLCMSASDEAAGIAIDITSTGSGTHRISYASGKTKHLKSLSVMTSQAVAPAPMTMYLMDYLIYYPFIDQGTSDPQVFTNTVTLPRYTDGEGVMMMAVMTNPQAVGGATFNISYTNQDGVAGRTPGLLTANTTFFAGSLLTSAPSTANCFGPFIPLQRGDTGVRSIESLTMVGADVGLMALVLVKPIATLVLRLANSPVERDYMVDFPSLPRIHDGAYLNFITMQQGTLSSTPLVGLIQTVWN